jgi:transposase
MRSIGIDLGKINSQFSERDEKGAEVTNQRFRTTRECLEERFSGEKARFLLEAGTPTRWVARVLVSLGHEVVVADPNYLPMYVDKKSKRKKTDKRDASTLSAALHQGNFRTAHLRSDVEQANKMRLDARSRLVETRTKHISAVRASFSQWGIALKMGESTRFAEMAGEKSAELPEAVQATVKVELALLAFVTKQVHALDAAIEKSIAKNPIVTRLMTAPSIGPITSAVYAATIDDPNRFSSGGQVASFLGLVPSEMSSGERRLLGRITKAGPAYLRHLLVQAAWSVWRSKRNPDAADLRAWMEKIAAKRGKNIAVVAAARKLAVMLWAMWKKGNDFDPKWHLRRDTTKAALMS